MFPHEKENFIIALRLSYMLMLIWPQWLEIPIIIENWQILCFKPTLTENGKTHTTSTDYIKKNIMYLNYL